MIVIAKNFCFGLALSSLCIFSLANAQSTYAVKEVSFPGPSEVRLRALLQTPSDFPGKDSAPAVVFLHGCGGVGAKGKPNARHQTAMDWANARGYVALMLDSFSPREVSEICTQKLRDRTIVPATRAQDAHAALAYLQTVAGVDGKRVALWGWSHGGSTVLHATHKEAMGARLKKESPAFAASIAFYPGCSPFLKSTEPYTLAHPMQIFVGEADDWTPPQPCLDWAKARQEQSKTPELAIKSYPGAYHDFDNPAPNARVRVRTEVPNGVNPGKGVTVGPNPEARVDAMKRAEDFLARQFAKKS